MELDLFTNVTTHLLNSHLKYKQLTFGFKEYFIVPFGFLCLKIACFFLFCSLWVEAREIRFPEEELAAESVLPIFPDNNKVTMNRNVKLKYKMSMMSSIDYRADDPFYSRLAFTGDVGFFLSEAHGLSLLGMYFFQGVSSIGEFFSKPNTELQNISFHATEVPHPRYAFLLNYNWIPFYGKLSLLKNVVMNYNISLHLGGGTVALVQDRNPGPYESYDLSQLYFAPILITGINQKIFIGKRFYIHGWLRFFFYYGPNPVWCRIGAVSLPVDKVDSRSCSLYRSQTKNYDQFEKSFVFRNLVGAGFGALLF